MIIASCFSHAKRVFPENVKGDLLAYKEVKSLDVNSQQRNLVQGITISVK